MAVAVGSVLADKYEILAELGKSPMARVYQARHRLMNKIVAIKVLSEAISQDPYAIQRFEKGVRATGSLSHPNIVSALDFGLVDDRFPFMVIDFVDGQSLQDVLNKEQRLSWERSAAITIQICEGLQHAHSQGIVHRNLKPSNIMLSAASGSGDFVKVIDFGLAKIADEKQKLTRDGEVFGTPAFMSPEQCASKDTDARSDIYALGCLIFKMITGVPPVSGVNALETLMKQATTPPLSFKEACPNINVPTPIQQTIFKAMAKNPGDRFQTMSEFKDALARATVSQPAEEPVAPQVMPGVSNYDPFMTAVQFQQGAGVPRDLSQAIKQYLNALSQGNNDARPALVACITEASNSGIFVEESIVWLRKAAQSMMMEETLALANVLGRRNQGSDRDEALKWFERAAELGDANTQLRLGSAYLQGLGLTPDPSKAFRFLSAAGRQNVPDALFLLYSCYSQGLGVATDPKLAFQMLERAAALGHSEAQQQLKGMKELVDAAAVADPQVKALLEAAAQQDCSAQINLALRYKTGNGVPTDLAQADQWFGRAAEQRFHNKASGPVAPGDPTFKELLKYFHDIGNRGHKDAQYWLGICYEDGLGVNSDPKQAAKWYLKAAERGHSKAQKAVESLPAHIVDMARQGKPKWDKSSTKGTFALRQENKALIRSVKSLAEKDTLSNRVNLYESFPSATLIVPCEPSGVQTQPTFVVIANSNGERGLVAFTDFDAMSRWPYNSPKYSWNEIGAKEISELALKGQINAVFLNPVEVANCLLRKWELDLFARNTYPVQRGAFSKELIFPDGTIGHMRLLDRRPSGQSKDTTQKLLKDQHSVRSLFVSEVILEPVAEPPRITLFFYLDKAITAERRESIARDLRSVLADYLIDPENTRFVFLEECDLIQQVRRNAFCLYQA